MKEAAQKALPNMIENAAVAVQRHYSTKFVPVANTDCKNSCLNLYQKAKCRLLRQICKFKPTLPLQISQGCEAYQHRFHEQAPCDRLVIGA
ncbi:MAG: hypothetical protein EBS61_08620, partial [Betaproteobacteria bacterium]|nr:hypothetical protein [Betaproteobacteria bacterium]